MEITQALEKELQPPSEAVSIINQITLSANNQEHTTLLKEMETELQAEKQRTNNWYNPDQLTRELLDKIAVQFHSMIRRVGSIPELISAKDLSILNKTTVEDLHYQPEARKEGYIGLETEKQPIPHNSSSSAHGCEICCRGSTNSSLRRRRKGWC